MLGAVLLPTCTGVLPFLEVVPEGRATLSTMASGKGMVSSKSDQFYRRSKRMGSCVRAL
jgi:hypothetical protein